VTGTSTSAITPRSVAILGASGYTGRELARLVRQHPHLHLAALMSARPGAIPEAPALPCDPEVVPLDLDALTGIDGVFACTPHGAAAELVAAVLQRGCKVVDLSADFRLRDAAVYAAHYGLEHRAPQLLPEAVYGLTEHHRDAVAGARLVANPGCYPTAVLLPLLPLLAAGLIDTDLTIIADAKSGVSGAGKTPSDRTIFGAVSENVLAYGVGVHRHQPEIHQGAGTENLVFVPHLLPMFRGMLATVYVTPTANGTRSGNGTGIGIGNGTGTQGADVLRACLAERYAAEPFIQVFDRGQPETNRVAGTNQCHIAVAQAGSKVVLTSAIDNLGKGAAGQALHNMNLMLGLPEGAGLT
jgi:N-acetyl-gamma-glutamyl-phosphate reductase